MSQWCGLFSDIISLLCLLYQHTVSAWLSLADARCRFFSLFCFLFSLSLSVVCDVSFTSFCRITGYLAQTWAYWLLSCFTSDVQGNARNGGIFRSIEAVSLSHLYRARIDKSMEGYISFYFSTLFCLSSVVLQHGLSRFLDWVDRFH